jgi:hypothetical protein
MALKQTEISISDGWNLLGWVDSLILWCPLLTFPNVDHFGDDLELAEQESV